MTNYYRTAITYMAEGNYFRIIYVLPYRISRLLELISTLPDFHLLIYVCFSLPGLPDVITFGNIVYISLQHEPCFRINKVSNSGTIVNSCCCLILAGPHL